MKSACGYGGFGFWQHPGVNWSNHPNAPGREMGGSPILNMTGGFLIGQGHANSPVDVYQKPYSVRDDLTLSYNARGRHDLKTGGEYIHMGQTVTVCDFCMPTYDMQGGPVPANIATHHPEPVRSEHVEPRGAVAGHAFDTPERRRRLRSSPIRHRVRRMGAGRLDHRTEADAESRPAVRPRVRATCRRFATRRSSRTTRRPDNNNFAPRLGFAYSVNDRTVIRGGTGSTTPPRTRTRCSGRC